MNQNLKNDFLDTALYAAESASKLIEDSTCKSVKTFKSKTNLVTETDLESEKKIKDIIKKRFPDHNILAEESGLNKKNNSKYTWVIDPLDGTTNFVHNFPSYAVSISLIYNNDPIVGVVVEMPFMNTYWATCDSHAYCNGQIINVSNTKKLIHSLLVTGFGYDHDTIWKKNMELFKEFTKRTQGVRRLGAAAIDLCHTAIGISDGFWEYNLNPWDVCAGMLIAKRAGARISKMNGDEYSIYDREILVTNQLIHEEMIEVIKETI